MSSLDCGAWLWNVNRTNAIDGDHWIGLRVSLGDHVVILPTCPGKSFGRNLFFSNFEMYKEVKYKFCKASQMVDQPCDILPYL